MPKEKFITIGSGKVVHTVTTKANDLKEGVKGAQCPQVRKAWVADKINAKAKGISPEAALALDGCGRCATHDRATLIIKAAESPEEKRARAKDKRDETLEKARKPLTKAEQRKRDKAQGKTGTKDKSDKPKKERKASPTKSGPRSIGSTGEDKAKQLVDFAKEHGWKASSEKDGQHLRVTAVRGDETINVWYIDGKYDPARPAEVKVDNWSGKLRGAHSARRQMSGEGRDRPHPNPGTGRSAPRKGKGKSEEEAVPDNESPEDAKRRVPFSIDDEPAVILDMLVGKTIKWRNGVNGQVEEAWLPLKVKGRKRDTMSIDDHPKSGKRILNFLTVLKVTGDGPVYGPERSVYLDKIIRVKG